MSRLSGSSREGHSTLQVSCVCDQAVLQPSLWSVLAILALLVALYFPGLLWLFVAGSCAGLRYPQVLPKITHHPWFQCLGGWKTLGIVAGVLLFAGITSHSEPAMAQLFNTAEQQANNIFGQYLDRGIIVFLFGMLRIIVWVSAVGFIFFAVYQAQRGEQWQPLLQNAFIIIAAVVVVEGLSRLFFGTA